MTETTVCASGLRCPAGMACGADDVTCVPAECADGTSNSPLCDTRFACRDVPFTEPSEQAVDVSLSVFNLVGFAPYEGLTVQECPHLDTDCESPVEEVTTDETGRFTLSLEEGFRGHLFVPTPADNPTLVPLKVPSLSAAQQRSLGASAGSAAGHDN